MEIPPLSASQAHSPSLDKLSPEGRAKIADSCKQFEAVLWRQMLEKALEPMLHSTEASSDKTGTYSYFLTNSISESVSGGPTGISSMLQAQLLKNPQET